MVLDAPTVSIEQNFVAIAVCLDNEGAALHCGLVVNYNQELSLFHFDINDEIKKADPKKSKKVYYLNRLPLIREQEVEAFLTKCELIYEKEIDLEYGFSYTGEFFDENNEIVFKAPIEGITNCVFFCISVIAGFLVGDSYFAYSDWTADKTAENWLNSLFVRTKRKEQITEEQFKQLWSSVRRIPPNDYFSSAPITELPITKVAVDEYSFLMSNVLVDRHQQANPAFNSEKSPELNKNHGAKE